MKVQVKNKVVLGNGETSVNVLKDDSKNYCVLFGDIEQHKIGEVLPKELPNDTEYSVITFKNSKGTKVLLDAVKAIYKTQKKNEKELGLNNK